MPYFAPSPWLATNRKIDVEQLLRQETPALVADNQMRQRDERFADQVKHKAKSDPLYDKQPTGKSQAIKLFKPADFSFGDDNTCSCPAGKTLVSTGVIYVTERGLRYQNFVARPEDCSVCALRAQCQKNVHSQRGRQVAQFEAAVKDPHRASERMKHAIDSVQGRRLYSQRIGTVEPVFANIRHNKRLNRFNLRGASKVNTQWHLYCMVHNIEKLANSGWRQ